MATCKLEFNDLYGSTEELLELIVDILLKDNPEFRVEKDKYNECENQNVQIFEVWLRKVTSERKE